MRVVLIEIEGHGHLFLAEPPAEGPTEAASAPPKGVHGWFARKRAALLAEMKQARGVVGRTIKGVWTRLQRLVAPDESLLRSLRVADRVILDYPAKLAEANVRAMWDDYLGRRMVKHRNWLIVDATLAVPSVLLALVPGPNVVGYWLCYRGLIHFLARRGAARARRGAVPTALQPRPELDAAVSPGDDERIEGLASALAFPDFGTLLARMAPHAIAPVGD